MRRHVVIYPRKPSQASGYLRVGANAVSAFGSHGFSDSAVYPPLKKMKKATGKPPTMVGRKGLGERGNPKEAVPKYDHSV